MTAAAVAIPRPAITPTAPTPPLAAVPSVASPTPSRRRDTLGDPTPLACTVARIALEVALGGGGVDQLTRWVTPTVRTALLRQHSLAHRASYRLRGTIGVARVRLCRVSASAVEAAVVATEGDVTHAIAMRLETVAGRWLVTVLDVG